MAKANSEFWVIDLVNKSLGNVKVRGPVWNDKSRDVFEYRR